MHSLRYRQSAHGPPSLSFESASAAARPVNKTRILLLLALGQGTWVKLLAIGPNLLQSFTIDRSL